VLISRAVHWPLPRWLVGLEPGRIVVFGYPHRQRSRGVLRVLALPGDTVSINRGPPPASQDTSSADTELEAAVLPPEYSPRDYTVPFRLPKPGEVYRLDSLSQRDFIFYASMYAQQRASSDVDVVPVLLIDDQPTNEYIVQNFALYEGAFDSIPDSLDYDWFFWDRLYDNLSHDLEGHQIQLVFRLYGKGERVETVRIRKRFVFVLADNWQGGYDSRYFGPLCTSHVVGTVPLVLWSGASGDSGGLRPARTFHRVR